MKKTITLLAVLFGSMATISAQDIITLKNGDEIKAKVQEVGLSDVKYKKFDNLTGPTYTLLKTEIFMIKYENGEKDIFKESAVVTPAPKPAANQPQTNALSYRSGFWSGVTITDGRGSALNKAEIRSILSDVPDALNAYNSGVAMHTAGWVFMGAGYGFLAISLIDIVSSDYESYSWLYWDMLAIGCGITAMIFDAIGNSKWRTAVNVFNSAKSNPYAMKTSLNFGLTRSGGIGLTLTF
jgi:hypothetical protein